MALPTLTRSWNFLVNQAQSTTGTLLTDRQKLLFAVKNALVSLGWTVARSSDGSSVADGDLWPAYTNLVWNTTGNAHSWIVLKQTGLGANWMLVLDLNAANTSSHLISAYCTALGYDLSTGSTTARPTVTGGGAEVTLLSSAQYCGPLSSYNFYFHAMVSVDGKGTRVLFCMNDVCQAMWMFDAPSLDPDITQWTDAAVACMLASGTDAFNAPTYANFNDLANLKGRTTVGALSLYMSTEGYATGMLGENLSSVANELTGKWPLVPIGLVGSTSGQRGYHGSLVDLWFGASGVVIGSTFPYDSSRQFVQVGQLVFPWNGTTFFSKV